MAESSAELRPTLVESEFISMVRFLMIVGLAYHHLFEIPGSAFYPRDPMRSYTYFVPDLMNGFFHMAFMAAVPALSVISGYLWFRRHRPDFSQQLKKRFFTVAMPSWLWAAAWLLVGPRLQPVLERLRRYGWWITAAFVLALCARLFAHEADDLAHKISGAKYLCMLRILGVLSFAHLLYILGQQDGPLKRLLLRYSGYSFFVFAAHYPLLQFVEAAAHRVPGHGSAPGYLLMWLLIPLFTVVLSLVTARVLELSTPRLFSLLNGGRSGHGAYEKFVPKAALLSGRSRRGVT